MAEPVKTDKGCGAKTALAAALHDLADTSQAADVFWLGVRHVQMEPVWGTRVDTAVELRAICAMALAPMPDPDVLPMLVDLLTDEQAQARAAAARALAHRGGDEAAALLRLRVRVGDEPQVLLDCLLGLLQLAPRQSLPLMQSLLQSPDQETADATVLALGQSRCDQAFDLLQAQLRRIPATPMTASASANIMLAMALLRSDQSLAFLIDLVRHADQRTAVQAIEALAMYRDDPALRYRLQQAASMRMEPAIHQALEQLQA
jgi:HEAT repeat protein